MLREGNQEGGDLSLCFHWEEKWGGGAAQSAAIDLGKQVAIGAMEECAQSTIYVADASWEKRQQNAGADDDPTDKNSATKTGGNIAGV